VVFIFVFTVEDVEYILKGLRDKGNVKIIDTPHYVEKK